MRKKKVFFFAIVIGIFLAVAEPGMRVAAAQTLSWEVTEGWQMAAEQITASERSPETEAVRLASVQMSQKGTWIKKKGKYYLKYADGTIRKKAGLISNGKYTWYTRKDGSRLDSAFLKIKGKYYYFNNNGKLYRPNKAHFRKLAGSTYYFYKDGHVATGRTKIKGKYYYFSDKGVLQKNQRSLKVDGNYYDIDASGVMTKISETCVNCSQAAWQFINAHSNSSQSNAQRFRSCFNYLLAYMKYTPGYYLVSSDYKIIDKGKEGVYELALSTFNSPVLRGNCHRFAACIGVIAKELGYSPTVIAMTGDHSFVMINGGYYDNMYGGLFGASSRPAYTVYRSTQL